MTHLPRDEAFRDRTSLAFTAAGPSPPSPSLPPSPPSATAPSKAATVSLTRVTLPAYLNSMGDCAFEGCSALTTVTFPATLTSIGDSAFAG